MTAERSGLVAAALLVVAAAVLPFLPAAGGPLVDDGEALGRGFQPLRVLSFDVDRLIGGSSAVGPHVHSLLWHALASFGVLLLLRRFVEPLPAVLAALLFALHPVQVESVAWISARGGLMAGALTVLALLVSTRGTTLALTLGPLLLAAALLCGDVALAGPVLLVLLLAWRRGDGGWKPAIVAAAPQVAVVAGYLVIASRMVANGPVGGGLGAATLLGAGRGAARVAESLLFPSNLKLDHHVPRPGPGEVPVEAVVLCLVLFAILLIAVRSWHRGGVPGLGVLWLILALLPGLGLVSREEPTADRFLYLPMVGFAILGGGAIASLRERSGRPAAVGAAGLALVALLTVLTLDRATDWRSESALWESSLHDPRSGRHGGTATSYRAPHAIARRDLALVRSELTDPGDEAEALTRLERARRLAASACDVAIRYGSRDGSNPWPAGPALLAEIELELARRGRDRWLAALAAAEMAARTPGAESLSILGEICGELGLLDRAEAAYAAALNHRPGDPALARVLAATRIRLAEVAIDSGMPLSIRRAERWLRLAEEVGGAARVADRDRLLEALRQRHADRIVNVREAAVATGGDPTPDLFRVHVEFGRDEAARAILESPRMSSAASAGRAFWLLHRGTRADLEEARGIYRNLALTGALPPPALIELAQCLLDLTDLATRDGRFDDALEAGGEGLGLLRQTGVGRGDMGRVLAVELLAALARANRALGREDRALGADTDTVEAARQALGHPEVTFPHAVRARLHLRAGLALERLGRPVEAREELNAAAAGPLPERRWVQARIRRLEAGGEETNR